MRSFWRKALPIFALAVCAGLAPIVADAAPAPKKTSYRSLREGMFGLSQITAASVVMLGDSLTEGAQWAEITGCGYLANRGISGDDSAGVLRRLDGVTSLKPAAVFLMIGVNDIGAGVSADTIADNTRGIIERLIKAGAKVYLSPVLPVTGNSRKINPKIDEVNRAYLKIAKETKAIVVDFRADMRDGDGFLKEEFSRDGLHLTAEGYRVWRDAIAPLVQQHCVAPAASPPQAAAPRPTPARGAPIAGDPPTAPHEFNTRFGPYR